MNRKISDQALSSAAAAAEKNVAPRAEVIAIDGPAASGKSTAARSLARALGIPYINTGSLYRATAWKAVRSGIAFKDAAALDRMLAETRIAYVRHNDELEIAVDGVCPGAALRTPEIARGASDVATVPEVRARMLSLQREEAAKGLCVLEGRDIGTVVCPEAKYKFFLTASPRARALRRLRQTGEAADGATVDSVAAEIAERDRQDSQRPIAPLKQASDAELVDSSELSAEETLALLLRRIRERA